MSKESAYFQLSNLSGAHDTKELKRELGAFHGVLSVSVNTEKDLLTVDYDNTGVSCDRLEKCLNQLGYQIESHKTENQRM
ncbi:MAG: heavy metal-associated domain-containing protein [Oscillospiraceae bacterium]|nr:heavy metal-associated domain-containing protein [Oscillospiraceae bacterium]